LIFDTFSSSEEKFLKRVMPSQTMPTNDEETAVLNSTKMAKKSGSKKKGTAKPAIRKARPLKNVSSSDLQDRVRELQKRVTTAECKTLLLRDRLEAHTSEITLREEEQGSETQAT
jgi:hypothetical protein